MSTEMTTVDAQLKARQDRLASKLEGLSSGGEPNLIRINNGVFILPDGETKFKNTLKVVVLDFAYFYAYYKSKFIPGQAAFPDCFAVGVNTLALKPSNNSPEKQHDACVTCPMNEFGSGDGNAKACQNRINLAVQLPDLGGSDGPVYRISVSPTALKNWKAISEALAKRGFDTIQVIIEIGVDPNVKYDKLTFSPAAKVPAADLPGYLNNADAAAEMLLSEPVKPEK